VRANKGVAGVDGLDIDQTAAQLRTAWPAIREQLLSGTYRPSPVRRVAIPKPEGGERELGVPTVTDRLIQQALLQVLQPLLDPTFSEHSYGFRPGRGAHDAVVQTRTRGTPQGGPLSPLLANVLLDEVDKALERRGHCFVRYADDANVYVRSRRAGERVMALLRRLYGKLRLTLNETKSAVTSVFGRKFLGYSFWVAPGGVIKRKVAVKPLMTFKQHIRQLTCRSGGRSMQDVVDRLRPYVRGWKAYFRLAQTPRVWRELDQWLRHRLRAIQLKQWKRGTTMYRELLTLGAKLDVARQVAANSRRWWRNSGMLLNAVLTLKWSDRLGLPRLS
jgi:RNA-directed DNA polymerase